MPQNPDVPAERPSHLLSGIDPEHLRRFLPLSGVVTMMFTDIVDSTRVKAKVGDSLYFAALEQHDALMQERVAVHDGRPVNTGGDSFFVVFDNPDAAIVCASEVQQQLREQPIMAGSQCLSVRIGLHTGRPLTKTNAATGQPDYSGTDVDKAARIEGIARGAQVLVSEQTRALARTAMMHD